MTPAHNPQVLSLRWRAGSKNHRTVYAQLGDAPSLEDVCLGMMDSPELAEECVRRHNAYGIGMYDAQRKLDDALHAGFNLQTQLDDKHRMLMQVQSLLNDRNRQLDQERESWQAEVARLRHNLDQEHDLALEYTRMHTELKAAVDRAGFEVVAGDFVLRDGTKTRYQLRVRAASTVLRQVGAWLDSQVMGGLEAVVNARTGEPVATYRGECNCGVDTVGNQNHLPNCPMYLRHGTSTGISIGVECTCGSGTDYHQPNCPAYHSYGAGPDC